jgi:glycine/D-amino acid oxidase-like deaminating enzyme
MRKLNNKSRADNIQKGKELEAPWWKDVASKVLQELPLEDSSNFNTAHHKLDLVIIGGGIAGLSAAVAAAERGLQTVVLEASSVLGQSGATGRSAGIISAGVNMPLHQLAPTSAGIVLWKETVIRAKELLREENNPNSLLQVKRTGSYDLATTKAAANRHRLEKVAMDKLGIECELVTASDFAVASSDYVRTDEVHCGLYFPDSGWLHPLSLLAFMANKARKAGARLIGNCKISSYEFSCKTGGKSKWIIHLENGKKISAPRLLVATGPTINPTARLYALAFELDLPKNFPLFWDANPYTYYDYRPGNGKITTTGGCYGKPGSVKSDPKYFQRVLSAGRHWMPALENVQPHYIWAVDLKLSADTLPRLRSLNHNTAFAIEGLGALGILPGIVLGNRAVQKLV